MSNLHNEQQLEDIHYQVVEWDRDEILEFITESILYEKNVGGLV